MNNEAFQKTLNGPDVWFYSRTRKSLWHKGETSGNYLRVKNITTDCDKDALLITLYLVVMATYVLLVGVNYFKSIVYIINIILNINLNIFLYL